MATFVSYDKMTEGKMGSGFPEAAKCIVMEKVHGANASVLVSEDGDVSVASRRRIVTEAGAFFSSELVLSWLRPRALALRNCVADVLAPAGVRVRQLDVVGELFGGLWPGGTRGNAVQTLPLVFYSPKVEFMAFDLRLHLDEDEGRYVDWPVAERLLAAFGVPTVPQLAITDRGSALHWSLPMQSRVPAALGHALPETVTDGRDAEGVVVRCEVEQSPIAHTARKVLAVAAGLLEADPSDPSAAKAASVAAEAASGRGGKVVGSYTGGEALRWCRLAGLSGGKGAAKAAADESSSSVTEEEGSRGTKRWMTKIKCEAFKEAHGSSWGKKGSAGAAKRIAEAYAPKKATRLPAPLIAAVCARLTEARMGSAMSKVGPPPPGAYVWLERWGGKPAMPLWSKAVAASVLTDSGSSASSSSASSSSSSSDATTDSSSAAEASSTAAEASSTAAEASSTAAEASSTAAEASSAEDKAAALEWATAVASELCADLFEELWRDESSLMASADTLSARMEAATASGPPALTREASDPFENSLTKAVRGAGEEQGLSKAVVEALMDPVIAAITNLAIAFE